MIHLRLWTGMLIASAGLLCAGWVTGNRGATIESATMDARRFVSLLLARGSDAAVLSLYDDLPARIQEKARSIPRTREMSGDPALINDMLKGAFKRGAIQKLEESAAVRVEDPGHKAYRFVFRITPRNGRPCYAELLLSYAGFGSEHGSREFRIALTREKPKAPKPI